MYNELIKVMDVLYKRYVSDFSKSLKENNSEDSLEETLRDDLLDKGFSDDEIDNILEERTSIEDICKFVAYASLLFNEFDSTEELKLNIEENTGITIEDNAVLQKILNKRDSVDY